MASLKRSKTLPADGQTAKFLYTIIKQLDLKSIDWSLVASQLEITNGHAARMRFSRFRQHMEGTSTTPRTQRPKKSKVDKAQAKQKQFSEPKPTIVKAEPVVKKEPIAETTSALLIDPTLQTISMSAPYPAGTVAPADLALPNPAPASVVMFHTPPTPSALSSIKAEVLEQDAVMRDVPVKMETPGED
ncbi:hypothetical protein AJ80_04715 [Polytolypa hystricis UAMH7299]|uniref:Myb-like DNA-binding domain-containing protein n=1 Tax=Polytolypa hystricis (strain UAMH7299) TaxID=1447883 RepID=A0A2B7YAS9_POLH7|nr:hypothetical protein AJ80_04715 [Polytolypa hystricis UAMH7299]